MSGPTADELPSERFLREMRDAVRYPFHDPVHKRVWLTAPELRAVDTPEFQRLRGVSQLGLADYVFPGATRTRFSHSLGALYVMGELLQADHGEIVAEIHMPGGNAELRDRVTWQHLRLAALLHDIGHLPFSHPTEEVYSRIADDTGFGAEAIANGRPDSLLDQAAERAKHDDVHHERFAEELLLAPRPGGLGETLAQELDDEEAPAVIAELIRRSAIDNPVASALLSSDLDADRLDYVMRDADSAGFAYGEIDLDYLVENAIVAKRDGREVFAIDGRHGSGPLEHYLLARSFIYSQLVHHKTIAAAELLLRAVMLASIRQGVLPALGELRDAFINSDRRHVLTDGYFLSQLAERRSNLTEDVQELVWRLETRRLPKVAYSDATFDDSVSGLKLRMQSVAGKDEICEHAKTFLSGKTLKPSDFCFMERERRLIEVDDPSLGEASPEAVMLGYGSPPSAKQLDRNPNSLFYGDSGRKRVFRYVFVLEDRKTDVRTKPRAAAIRLALEEEGLIEPL